MPVHPQNHGSTLVLRILEERLDLSKTEAVRAASAEHIAGHAGAIVLDMSGVRTIDSSGIGLLAATAKQLKTGLPLVIAAPSREVKVALNMTRIDRVLRVRESVEAAVRDFDAQD